MLCLAALAAGCNSAGKVMQQAAAETAQMPKTDGEAAPAAPDPIAAAAARAPKDGSRQGGTFIRVMVNGEGITNREIARRQKFRQVRRMKAGEEDTIRELVDDRLKLQEAAKRNMVANDAQVAEAFANFAKGNRATPAMMAQQLNAIGIGADHFKEYIRAQISWNRALGAKVQSETARKSQSALFADMRKKGEAKPVTNEFVLSQVIFVVPEARRKAMLGTRMKDAAGFRAAFAGCDGLIGQAKAGRDVTIRDLGRMMEPELPPRWKDAIAKLDKGGITEAQETEKGVELIAVCDKRSTSDDRAAEVVFQAETFKAIEAKGMETISEETLAQMRQAAKIEFR